jgi:hypothetical protein
MRIADLENTGFAFINPQSAFRNAKMTPCHAEVLTTAVEETARKMIGESEETAGAKIMKSRAGPTRSKALKRLARRTFAAMPRRASCAACSKA